VILVDTSVWADHFRVGDRRLSELLEQQQVLTHPFVIGELACGRLRHRSRVLADLERLPMAPLADHREVLALIERRSLAGTGIGWVDAHLLASALIARAFLWTKDRTLERQARRLGLSPAA
jgi:predicted nucleic acid-binding protein